MIQSKMHTAIPVLLSLDTPATVQFYTSKLGFACRYHQSGGRAILVRDDIELHFTACPEQRLVDWSCCRIAVTGVDALYEEYSRQGVIHPTNPHGKPHDTDYGTREFGVVDCHGVLLTFYERKMLSLIHI